MVSGQSMPGNMHDHHHHCRFSKLCWGAVFAGAFVGIGLSFLLNLFCVAIGLTIFPTSTSGMLTLAIGGFVGFIIGVFVVMFVAGWVAGYLGRPYCFKRNLGTLYGFTTWCLALILTVMLTSYMGRYVSFYSNFISNPSAIVLTTDMVAPASASTTSTSTPVQAISFNAENAPNTIGMGALVVFVLFAIGALASCFGGHCGMRCKSKDSADECCK